MKIKARKRFGQNFLVNSQIIEQIIESVSPNINDHLVEIGPGLGALTLPLVKRVKQFTAIEIDRDLILFLQNLLSDHPHFKLIEGDVLAFDFSVFPDRVRIISNLPYNISTPVLFHLFQYASKIIDLTIMLQKEVVERLQAKCNTKNYGRLTVMAQYHCEMGATLFVGPNAFKPSPKVDSMVIQLKPHSTLPFVAKDYALFEAIVREAFSHRRKQLKNSLSKYITEAALLALDIAPNQRPEAISLEEYVRITNSIYTEKNC